MEEFAAQSWPALAEALPRTGATIVIGSGSVAAANLPGLVHELRMARPEPVVVILTRAAEQFVTPTAVRHLGRCPVLTERSAVTHQATPLHVWLTDFAHHVLVYPASAAFLGRVAAGITADLAALTMACATGIPTLIVPSMHPRMWSHPAVRRNVRQLRGDGIEVMDVTEGLAPPIDVVVAASIRVSPPRVAPTQRRLP